MKNKNIFLIVLLTLFTLFSLPLEAKWKPDLRPPLYEAINASDFAKAQEAIQQGADINAIHDRDSMLCWALRNENADIIKLLLNSPKIDVNKRSKSYDAFGEWERTPLILAAHMGQAEMVGILLQKGAKVNAKDATDSTPESRGNTAIIKAAQRNHSDVIEVLVRMAKDIIIDAKTKDGETALWFISEHENLESLKFLHKNGAKINTADSAGRSVLVTTFFHKNREVLEYLVANGADINHVNNYGGTTLTEAVSGLDSEDGKTLFKFLEKFLTFKPNLDLQKIVQNNGGESALHVAARNEGVEGAALLLDHGATIDLKNLAFGGTPLYMAASLNRIEVAKLLIKRDAKLDIFSTLGLTPLMSAVIRADEEMVKILVDAGATINAKSPVNILSAPLVDAASSPDPFKHDANLAIIEYLLDHKGDADFQSGNGSTALMAAAQKSNTSQGYERAELLIDKGANLDIVNNKGETALMIAAGAGNEKLVKLLMEKGADAQKKNGAGETVMNYAKRAGKGSATFLESKGVKPEAPIVHKSVIVDALLGTWCGFQDGLPHAIFTIVLNKNGTFDFNSKLTPEVMKQVPKGSMKETIASQKGTYTFNDDIMIWNPVGAPPTSMQWKLEKGMLIIDDKIRLKKIK